MNSKQQESDLARKALLSILEDERISKNELQKSEVHLRAIFENARDAIYTISPEGILLTINPAFEKLTGWTIEEWINKPFANLVHPEDLPKAIDVIQKVISGKKAEPYELRIKIKSGDYKIGEFTPSPLIIDGKIAAVLGIARDITERKRAEEAAIESETRMKLALEASKAGVWEWNLINNNVQWSEENFRLLGYEPNSVEPKYELWLDRVHPDDREKVNAQIVDAVEKRSDLDIEFRILLPDNSIRWINDRGKFILDETGKPIKMYGIQINITERKRAEEEIRHRSEELATLLKISGEFATTLDLSTILQLTTDRIAELTELKSSAVYLLEGETLRLWATTPPLPQEFPEEMRNAPLAHHPHIRKAITTGMPVFLSDTATAEFTPAERAISEMRGLRSILYLPLISGTKVLGILIVAAIEEPRTLSEAEINLCSTLANLAALAIENALLYEDIKESNSELATLNKIIITSVSALELNFILNKVMDDALNVVGLEGGTVCLINPDDTFELAVERGASQETIEDLTQNKVKVGDCLCGDCAKECKPLILNTKEEVLDYATREVLRGEDIRFHAAFPFVVGERCIGVLCVFTRTDKKPSERSLKLLGTIVTQTAITIENARLYEEVKKYTSQLEKIVSERTAELQTANKELEAFSYSVSHDLRAPLRAIDGFSLALLEDYSDKLNKEAKHHLERVRNGAMEMDKLINDLLNLSRLSRRELTRESVDISMIIKAIRDKLIASEPGRSVKFTIAENVHVVGDGGLLKIVMENLLNNAWKFTGKKKTTKIEFGVLEKEGKTVYYIKDNGVGFDMKYADKLFNPFQRLHRKEDYPGTGIGLATVHRIISKHGGSIWAESELGKGATFYFTI